MKKNRESRRQNTLERLEEQLKRGTRKIGYEEVSLTPKNIKRINYGRSKITSYNRKKIYL